MLDEILKEIDPKLHELNHHPLYAHIDSIRTLQIFMQRHAFAVFDFMSLTKSLQAQFSPVQVPWTPPKNRELSRFINEIVLAEESDQTWDGSYISHFEMYCLAMAEVKACDELIQEFIRTVENKGIDFATENLKLPTSAKTFLQQTFSLLADNKIHQIAAAFCFGREKIIPHMFKALLDKMKITENQAPTFHYYLKRHIEVDGDSHGPLALKMISLLCGTDQKKWEEAKSAAIKSIDARIAFWDNIVNELAPTKNIRETQAQLV